MNCQYVENLVAWYVWRLKCNKVCHEYHRHFGWQYYKDISAYGLRTDFRLLNGRIGFRDIFMFIDYFQYLH